MDGRGADPASLSAHGGVFAVKDARTIPDTAEVIFELRSGMLMTFGTYEANGHTGLKSGEIELRETLGTAFAGIDRFEIVPERGGAFQDPKPRRKPLVETARVDNETSIGPMLGTSSTVSSRVSGRTPIFSSSKTGIMVA